MAGEKRVKKGLFQVRNICYNKREILDLAAIIVSVDFLGIIVAVVAVLFAFVGSVACNKLEFELSVKQTPIQRRRDYTSRVLYQPQYAKEIRLNPVKGKLIQNFRNTNKELINTIWHYSRKMMKWDFAVRTFSNVILIDIVYMAYLLYRTIVKHAFTYGAFYALYSGTDRLRNSMEGLITDITGFHKHSLYIERFRAFIEYNPNLMKSEHPKKMPAKPEPLSLRNVSFTYESLKEPTLKNINLTIQPGEKIALVGFNGAGKSTLIKLLMRLYDVTEGEVLLGDTDIREYSVAEYRKYFGVVFQDYQIFAATIGENVKMDCVREEDEAAIKKALYQSGFEEKLNTLKAGTKTNLTREFDKEGVNLFNQSMLEAAKDKTVVFISHRLSTTRNADRIIMLANGEIIEEGSHEELMKLNGSYAQMFNMQAEKYRQEQVYKEG